MPPTAFTRTITDQEWEEHKDLIKQLYLDSDKPLKGKQGVIETLADRGFRASKSQYETYFKKWGFRKYRDKEQWRNLLKDTGQTSKRKVEDIYDGDELISASKVRKVRGRYKFNRLSPFYENVLTHPSASAPATSGKELTTQTSTMSLVADQMSGGNVENLVQAVAPAGQATSPNNITGLSQIAIDLTDFWTADLPFSAFESMVQSLSKF